MNRYLGPGERWDIPCPTLKSLPECPWRYSALVKSRFYPLNKKMKKIKLPLAVLFLVFVVGPTGYSQDWVQWRGPARDGSVPASRAPVTWPDSLRRSWRVEIGEGYSSPVVSAGISVSGRCGSARFHGKWI
jgi:hypothetical protein